jgi:hypothetical protein
VTLDALDALDATPWVQRTLHTVWDRVAAQVPESWMPRAEPRGRRRKDVFEEFGCGHYGCVMPTNEPDLVCKLTSDITEARFIARAMTLPPHDGIVEYKGLYALRGEERSAGWGHKRPMFILWRTEAFNVGLLTSFFFAFGRVQMDNVLKTFVKDDYAARTLRQMLSLLKHFQNEAHVVRKYVGIRLQSLAQGVSVGSSTNQSDFLRRVWESYERSSYNYVLTETGKEVFGAPKHIKGLARVGIAMSNCRAIAQEVENTPILNYVGEALGHYLDEGLLLADVHQNNIGVSSDNALIVTDPGHAVEVHPRWAGPVPVTEI